MTSPSKPARHSSLKSAGCCANRVIRNGSVAATCCYAASRPRHCCDCDEGGTCHYSGSLGLGAARCLASASRCTTARLGDGAVLFRWENRATALPVVTASTKESV